MKHLFAALAIIALLLSAAPASAGEDIRCIPLTLTVNTNHQGVEVLMGREKGGGEMKSYGVSPATIKFLAVVATVPGAKKPALYLLPDGEQCPGADADWSSMPTETRYFYIEPGHTGYEPVKNKKKDVVKLKQVLKALDAGEKLIEVDLKFTLVLPTGSSQPGAGGMGGR
jgi:hypothetical protein